MTDEQIKELWEAVGFYKEEGVVGYHYPGDHENITIDGLPPLDLNNLFKRVVPQAVKKISEEYQVNDAGAYRVLFQNWILVCADKNYSVKFPAPEMLAQACYEVLVK